MNDNILITLKTLLAIFGGITIVLGGISAIVKLFTPFKNLQKRVDNHDEKLARDFEKFKSLDCGMQEVEESNRIICKSLLVLLNHEITGNGVDTLKKQRDALEQFLINK